jgi:hypothetical protein
VGRSTGRDAARDRPLRHARSGPLGYPGPRADSLRIAEGWVLKQAALREVESGKAVNILLWALQILAALLYGSSGVMKVFLFEEISHDVPTFAALPREAWMALGILELACTIGLIVPAALRWRPHLTTLAATLLAVESLVFVWVHAQYHETAALILSGVLGLVMAFIAVGRMVLRPIVGPTASGC